MKSKHSKSVVITSLIWKFLERGGVSGVQFIVQIVLARLLLPSHFGTIAIITVFISFANIFVQSGFNLALIQKKDADEIDFSSVFYLSMVIAGLLYIIIFVFSSYIARFYRIEELELLLKILSLTLFIGALNSIQNAYLTKNMMFKKLFFCSFVAVFISGTTGILSAFFGAGIWALVIQQLTNQIVTSLILWFSVNWRPTYAFSIERIMKLFSFGGKLFVTSVLYTLLNDLRTLIVGKKYSHSMLGFYNRGEIFPGFLVNNIDGSIQSVMFPAFSSVQDDKPGLKNMLRRSIMLSSFLVFPSMVGLAVIAEPLVILLLTDKWLPAVPFIQIFCFTNAIRPMQGINLTVINAMGRSDINLRIFFIKRSFEFAVLIISINFGIYAIAFGTAVSALFSMIVNIIPNNKLLNYSLGEQFRDFTPAFFIAFIMGILVYLLKFLNFNPLQTMTLQIILGIITYFGLAKLFKLESIEYLIDTIKTYIGSI